MKDINKPAGSQQKKASASSESYTKANWSQVQKQARQRWNDLTESDLERAEGSHDYLVGKVQTRCGLSREQAEQQVCEFEKGMKGQEKSSTASRGGSQSNR